MGKTIRIFLVDSVPSGILTAEIINWTGAVLVTPRPRLADVADRPEVKRTGVYCLIGPDPDIAGKERVYIGESDNVFSRLASHHKDTTKDFWTNTAIIMT